MSFNSNLPYYSIGILFLAIIVYILIDNGVIKIGTAVEKDSRGMLRFRHDPDHPIVINIKGARWFVDEANEVKSPISGNWMILAKLSSSDNSIQIERMISKTNLGLDIDNSYEIFSGISTPLKLKEDDEIGKDEKDGIIHEHLKTIDNLKKRLVKNTEETKIATKDADAQIERRMQSYNRRRTARNTGGSPSTSADEFGMPMDDDMRI
jgi:hypothetical protein